mmetsp:Transcript_27188/g.73430  ORF Transcript_27188/g.73430 Transcript_27188/m.73430 type:complete len:253 (+) Transcript_27188:2250-3008(+)
MAATAASSSRAALLAMVSQTRERIDELTAAEYDEISGSDHDSMLRAGVISVGVQSAERARYCNVVGYDETRVEVSTGEWQNANHVRVRGLTSRPTKADDLRAIISQGPMHPDYHGPGEQFGRRRRRRPRTRPHQLREALREPRTRTPLITADRRRVPPRHHPRLLAYGSRAQRLDHRGACAGRARLPRLRAVLARGGGSGGLRRGGGCGQGGAARRGGRHARPGSQRLSGEPHGGGELQRRWCWRRWRRWRR